jgi:hypothetical protein
VAGAVAGLGALLAGVVAFTVLGSLFAGDPAVQEFVRASEPHPEARLPYAWIPLLGAALGGLVGLGVGLFHLVLATLGGLAVGVLSGAERRGLGEAIG